MANLGYQLAQRGHLDEAEQWKRRGTVLGHPGAMENLAVLLKERGDAEQALEWFHRGASRALTLIEESPRSFGPGPERRRTKASAKSASGSLIYSCYRAA
ncbi:hypothetical protein AB0451_07885 [Streptomyces sp. NPDC052000]|uniref:tetratricopeptide repeat protein n=1 Tax=Streptomyces sp. NPDC052000 TaxID=3155676 RepID=UPI00344C76A7